MPADTPARRVGPFQLEEKLGVGGMGVVYKATYLKTGQKVALKMLAPDLTADPKVAKRFEREMDILQKLKHPNIIRYYGGSTTGNQRWYAMELIAGGSMDRIIKEKGKIGWEDVIDYGIQIAMALEHSHAAGIIHRDLKPANLLLASNNTIKLTDFGIARDTDATALTQAGKTVGTMAYMAPEQITGKQPVSRKTDLYSLGCVLFEMLTGKTPFEAPTQPEVMFKHLEAEPPSVRELAWQTPVWLEELIEELLEKDPNERPFDALAVQVKLQEVKKKVNDKKTVVGETKGAAAGVTMQGDAVVTKAHSKKKKKKKVITPVYERAWFLGLVFLVVVGGASAWYLLKRYKPEDQRFAEVQQAVQSGEIEDLLNAESLIERMKADFPEGKNKDVVQRMLDDISAIRAERNLNFRLNTGKDPETEGERLWVNAKQFEKAGDRIIALEKYRAMEKLLSKDASERPFRSLARRQAEKIEAEIGGKGDRTAFINQWLVDADAAFRKGNRAEAQKIWKSVYDLYGSMPEFQAQVKQADDRLARPESALAAPAQPSGNR